MQLSELENAFVLHRREYRESSFFVDILTQNFGRISLLAKGAKKNHLKSILQPFTPLRISFDPFAQFKILKYAESISISFPLHGEKAILGLYINELLLKLLPEESEISSDFFLFYLTTLTNLAKEIINHEIILREFEFFLLEKLGYFHNIDFDIAGNKLESQCNYQFIPGLGFEKNNFLTKNLFSGDILTLISQKKFDSPLVLSQSKRLIRLIFSHLFQHSSLKTRELLLYYRNNSTKKNNNL